MIVTHAEARQMICPELTKGDRSGISVACISDRCMMWRDAGEGRGFCGRAGVPMDMNISGMSEIMKGIAASVNNHTAMANAASILSRGSK